MSVNYREPQWLLPNEKNLQYPAAGATQGSGLTADRHSLYSMDFDGVDDIITIDTSTGVDFSNPFSVSLWAKWTAADIIDNTAGIIQFAKESQTYSFMIGTGVGTNNNTFNVSWNNNNYSFGSGYGDGNWHNIIVTGDGVNWSGVKIYIDGTNVTSSATPESGLTVNSTVTYIGQNTYSPNRQFKGLIDEVAAWSREISSDEVNNLWNSGSPSNPMLLSGKPEAYYPLGEQARKPGTAEWRFPNEVLQGQAIDFDGSTDYIDLGNLSNFGNSSEITVSVWFNRDTTTNQFLLDLKDGSSRIGLQLYTSNSIYFYVNNKSYFHSTSPSINQWYNLIYVFNGAGATNADKLKMYLNGTELTGGTYSGTIDSAIGAFTSSMTSDIGRTPSTAYFNGQMSNVAIWDTDQSANITNIYNYGAPQTSYTVTPTAWYKLDKTSEYAGLNANWHNALSFNGSSNYINCGDSDSLSFGNGSTDSPFSISTWVNFDNVSSTAGIISKKGSSGEEWQMYTHSSTSNIRFLIKDDSVNKSCFVTGNTTLVTGKWYHIVSTYNGVGGATAGNGIKIYLNGVEETLTVSNNASYVAMENSTQPAEIGRYDTNYFEGDISNTAVFNQVISAEDIKYLYNGGTPQTNLSFEPLSWWKLDNLTTGIQDSGSASNNGTATGSPSVVTDSVAVDQWNFDNTVQSQTPNWSSALEFNRSGVNYLKINGPALNFTDKMSFSAWVKFTSTSQDVYTVAANFDPNTGYKFAIYYYRDNNPSSSYFRVRINSTNNTLQSYTVNGQLDVDKWYHLAFSFDGTTNANGVNLYIDNVKHSFTASNTGIYPNTANGTRIGNYQNNNTWAMIGEISNVAFWDTNLSTSQINDLYNNGQPEATISHSPLSYYKLDNIATGIQDSGSASNNANINGTITEIQTNVWTPRLNGESDTLPSTALVSSDLQFNSAYSSFSLDFDGTNDYVDCTDNDMFSFGDSASDLPFSISAWVNFEDVSSSVGIISKYGNSSSTREWLFYIAAQNFRFLLQDGSYNNFATATSTTISTDQWYHVVATYNGVGGANANQGMNIYVNGQLQTLSYAGSSSYVAMHNTSQPVEIARYGGSAYTSGNIDEVCVFNKVLNQAEITSIYNNGYPKDITALAPTSWWRLGEDAYFNGNDFIIPNKISGAPNGTSNGMPATALVADAPGSYAAGLGSSLVEGDRVGDAALSTANSLSINMTPENRVSYPAGYVPTQVDNVYSMAFDGANDYISTSDIRLGNTYSISLWFNAASFPSTNPVLISQYTSGLAGRFFLGVRDDGGGRKITAFSAAHNYGSTVISTSTWYNVVLVNNNNTVTLYLNGAVDGNFTFSSAPPDTDILIGALDTTPSNPWDGNIDEVAIFDYALSARQIKQDIYNGTTSGKTADLNNNSNLTAPVAWYRMGD